MRKTVSAFLFFLFVTPKLWSQDHIIFAPQPNQPIQSVESYLQFFEEGSRSLSISEILKKDSAQFFQPKSAFITVVTGKTWWVKLEMLPAFSSDSFLIGLGVQAMSGISHGNDEATVWVINEFSAIQTFETGTLTPLSKHPIKLLPNRNQFPVTLVANNPITIYWRLRQTINTSPLQFNFVLAHKVIATTLVASSSKLAWFYSGLMFILFMFGLVFLIITRERPFTWFTGMSAALFLHMQLLEPENRISAILFPEHPELHIYLFTLLTTLFGVLILQFIRSFAQTKTLVPKWDRLIIFAMVYMIVITLANFILMRVAPHVQIPEQAFLIVFIVNISIAIRLMLTKSLYARWAGFALLWLFFFQFLGILWTNKVLPIWFPNPWAIAQIGMMIILFFALAFRFKQSAKEKADAAKLLEMDHIKNQFFANISHEFRTPLTLLIGPLKQMEESVAEPNQKKNIGMMRRNANRLLQLINQLLDLSKLENGKLGLQVAKTDITSLLKVITSSFDSLAEQQLVNYHIHFPEEHIIGFVDADKLEKIVVNLLSNAFRFTAAGGTVSFSVEHIDSRLRFSVQDNGVGIPKEQLDKIFNRFYQIPGTEGGTGIGLALTKELLQLHKGQIAVQSEAGRGTNFRVSIPVSREYYSDDQIINSSETPKRQGGKNQSSLLTLNADNNLSVDLSLPLVLVVEDNLDLQQYISDTLSNDFRIEVAGDGQSGLDKAFASVPDCIVSDLMMPIMNGIELGKRLKNDTATSHIPFILLTAKAGTESRIEGLQTGADDYLVKPFDKAELIVRIQNLIQQRIKLQEKFSAQVISIQPEAVTVNSTEQDFIFRVRQTIDENIDNEMFGVAELAAAVHFSRSQLHRKLKALTGQAPNELIRNYRLERAMQLLQQKNGNVTEIAYKTGFSSPGYFSKCFMDRYGYSPTQTK